LTASSPTLTTITEDQTSNGGQLVSSFASASVSDRRHWRGEGHAITAATSTNGAWQFSVDNGSTWANFASYTSSSALLLAATDKVRFVPDGNNGGSDTITYKAWDQTSGTHGATANPGAGGGTTSFSTASDTASLTVTDVNDAPVLTASSPTLTTITEDQTSNGGQLVSSFASASISDVDTGAVKGIAITAATSANGTWQFSVDNGSTWTNFASYASSSALLLADTDKVRFVPDGNNGGSDTITYKAWDQTSGTHGATANPGAGGGATSFSTASDTASLTVTDVNDAPTATAPASYGATEQVAVSLKNASLSVSDVDGGGASETITLSVVSGTLSADVGDSGATIDSGNNSSSLVVSGTLAQLNAFLGSGTASSSTLTYTDTAEAGASTTLTLSINDNGHTGSGGSLIGSVISTINIAEDSTETLTVAVTTSGSEENHLFTSTVTPTDR